MDQHAVEHILHRRKQTLLRHQERRGNHRISSVSILLTQTEQLHLRMKRCRAGKIHAVNFRDALAGNILIPGCPAADERGDDRDLSRRVMPLHIRLRIALRVPELLRSAEYRIKIRAIPVHLRQNVVGRPIQNAGDTRDVFLRQTCIQRAEQRNAAAHTCLEEVAAVMRSGCRHQLRSESGHQLLIRSADADALLQCRLAELICRALAAHRLTYDFDLRILQDHIHILHHPVPVRTVRKVPQIQNVLHLDAFRNAAADLRAVLINQRRDAAANRPIPKNCCLDHWYPSPFRLSSIRTLPSCKPLRQQVSAPCLASLVRPDSIIA